MIAHRGASGYLPEHTLAAKALAHAMGADFLEQDVVASGDDELIVLHDIHLDRVTNVAEEFPGRNRADGRYYARDFSLAELRRLRVWERLDDDGAPVYSGRFPAKSGTFRLHTLREELELIRILNASTGRIAGVYAEIKRPAWHHAQGVDMTPRLLADLDDFGYTSREDPAFVQCFDPQELRRIRSELDSDLKLVQLLGDNSWNEAPVDFDDLRTPTGIGRLADTVDAIGPWIEQLFVATKDGPQATRLVRDAHSLGLDVHPYTLRLDSLPAAFPSFEALIAFLVTELGVDGVFTDFPDVTRHILDAAA